MNTNKLLKISHRKSKATLYQPVCATFNPNDVELKDLADRLRDIIIMSVNMSFLNRQGNFTPNGVRSGKMRTQPSNKAVVKIVEDFLRARQAPSQVSIADLVLGGHSLGSVNNLLFEVEFSLEGEEDTDNDFKVDIAVLDKTTRLPLLVILTKFVNGDYNRNRYNYNNTTLGETARVLHKYPNVKILFLNFIPTVQANYNRSYELLCYQYTSPDPVLLSYLSNNSIYVPQVSKNVAICDIMYQNDVNSTDAKLTLSSRGSLSQKGQGAHLINKTLYYQAFVANLNKITMLASEVDKLRQYLVNL